MSSPKPTNTRLYTSVKTDAKNKFKSYPSLYASSWIVKEYKKRGGTYEGKKPSKDTGTSKWYTEQWVQVESYLKTGKKVQCGSSEKSTKACRPLKRINSSTPITIPELLKIHSKSDLIKLAVKKQKDMSGRVMWKTGNFFPSKSKSPKKSKSRSFGSSPAYSSGFASKLKKSPSNWSVDKPLYKPVKSDNLKKKGMVYVMKDGRKKKIHFGDSSMKDYTQHGSKERRKNYLSRSAGIRDGNGKLTANNKNSANYWSRTVLW
jgi:hypothetical protein